jgi:hypothetical protein
MQFLAAVGFLAILIWIAPYLDKIFAYLLIFGIVLGFLYLIIKLIKAFIRAVTKKDED